MQPQMQPPSAPNGLGQAVQRASGQPASTGLLAAAGQEMQALADESPNVSPEEQAQYDEMVTNAMAILYDQNVANDIVQMVSQSNDPVSGLADATVMIVNKLQGSAEDNGVALNSDVLQHAALEIIEQLADTLEQLGVHSYSGEEIESATLRAFDQYRENAQAQGRLDPASMEEDLMALIDAENNGVLDQILPGIQQFGGTPA